MARSGTITSPSGADANMRTLGDSQPPTGTLANIVRQALALAAALKGVIINFATGVAVVVPTGYADPAPTGAADLGHFTKDDPTKAVSPWTWVPGADDDDDITAQMEAIVATRKPSLSVESLTNAIEDVSSDASGALNGNGGAIMHYDQADGIVFVVESSAIGAYDPAAAYVEDAAFVRSVASSGTQFGE